MAETNTPNYNLIKPDPLDFYDVRKFNENADLIDAELKNINDNDAAHKADNTNPHDVTKEQVGLSNVTNDAQLKKSGDTANGYMAFNAGFGSANADSVIYSSSLEHLNGGLVFTNTSLFGIGSPAAWGFKFAATGSGGPSGSLNLGMVKADAPDDFIFHTRFTYNGEIILHGDNRVWHSGSTGPFYKGVGNPEGVVTAPVGSIYQRSDGGPSTTLYVKESGTGNVGWKAK